MTFQSVSKSRTIVNNTFVLADIHDKLSTLKGCKHFKSVLPHWSMCSPVMSFQRYGNRFYPYFCCFFPTHGFLFLIRFEKYTCPRLFHHIQPQSLFTISDSSPSILVVTEQQAQSASRSLPLLPLIVCRQRAHHTGIENQYRVKRSGHDVYVETLNGCPMKRPKMHLNIGRGSVWTGH